MASRIAPPPVAVNDARLRIQVELTPHVHTMLEHVSSVLGLAKSQLVVQALLQALPSLVDQADLVKRRAREVAAPSAGSAKR